MPNPRMTARRLALTMLAVFGVVALFVVKLVDIQVVRAAELTAAAESRRSSTITMLGERGDIVDAGGIVLADSVDRFDITASPRNVGERTEMTVEGERVVVPTAQAVAAVAEITGASATDMLQNLLADPDSNFTYLVKKVTLETYRAVFDLDIPWIYSELRPSRVYPSGAVAGNLVGFLGTDGPLAGTELRQDECLAGVDGTATFERGADGVRLPGSLVVEDAPVHGGTIHLTIESDLQWFAQQVLATHGTALGADWATAMIVRVSTGEIVAAADWPSIDPNDLNSVAADDSGARSFVAPFEPGSILKPVAFAALLDKGLITPNTQVLVPSSYTTGLPNGARIVDAWAHGELRYTATGVLMNSSNIGTAILSESLSAQDRYDYLRKFGFGEATDVDFLGESPGRVVPLSELDSVTYVTQLFGQGISVTSAQMASMYQALGNGGVRMPLTLVSGCELPDGTWTDVPVPTGERVVSEHAADTTLLMMETVASQGSLRNALTIPGYRIAAKTGTAEVPEGGVYGKERIVSLAGLVPADNPQYAIVVTLAKPDTMRTSAAAAPVFTEIAEQVIKTFRITPSTEAAPDLPLTW